ncbi:MAG: 2-oxoglutarate dehydrogenase E1 component [Opitutales bacterium]|nr:2-oxoglutarate dehydrogenase E1 component [Opitutales bacterium]
MKNPSFATRWNADVIDEHYARWIDDPESLDPSWRAFFEGFQLASSASGAGSASAIGSEGDDRAIKQARFTGMIYAYRSIGHTQANINPLFREPPQNPRLALERHGFSEEDLNEVFWSGNYLDGISLSVRELRDNLHKTYCGSIGAEYLHIQETPRRRWLQAKMEPTLNTPRFPHQEKLRILRQVIQAEQFEAFLHKNYVGQKRFGLEGGETLIAALDTVLERGPGLGMQEIVMGMAHRGRLNVLANVIGKSYEYIFHEFSENFIPDTRHGDGDVKYHLGYSSTRLNDSGESLVFHLAANPSHLEAVNPVVEGMARARQRHLQDTEHRRQVMPLLIHGDAAFAGQGIVAEVLNFSQLPGYRTGGTVHLVINNQIGFTTDPSEARSSLYCSDVAKIIEAPIFHVNGDDPEAVVWVMQMALEYRQEFNSDVVIDMLCYRRHGHNEMDEPAFTQPTLYTKISEHPLVSDIYGKQLAEEGVLGEGDLAAMREEAAGDLTGAYEKLKEKEKAGEPITRAIDGANPTYQPEYAFKPVPTNVDKKSLTHVARSLTRIPDNFNVNPKIKRQLLAKLESFEKDEGIDWAFAEALAWGTLMMEGKHVRLSGQDVARGTFSQRHAVFFDSKTREKYYPLLAMEGRKGLLCVHNSLLSEAAVLGFDYGYSLDFPDMLCMWEAQFGDFCNGAQVIIDQFIASSESKWQRVSGLVMLLPHGYEGQGPEHSSARLERFLQLCADDNIQVANLTTPAQYFHILRRQIMRDFRKPLVIMSPKSLLRHREAVSRKEDFTDVVFGSILTDPEKPQKAKRAVLCSGKVYYDLAKHRRENKITDTAIIRIEQLYPFNHDRLNLTMAAFPDVKTIVWCQEEPQNMGAWSFIAPILEDTLGKKPLYAGRDAAASPAVGSLILHNREQAQLVEEAFTLS